MLYLMAGVLALFGVFLVIVALGAEMHLWTRHYLEEIVDND